MSLPGTVNCALPLIAQSDNFSRCFTNGLLVLFCLTLVACDKNNDNSNQDTPEPTTQTIAASHGPRVTIGVDGVTNQSATITNPDNSVTDVTQESTWVSADESIAIVLEPGLIQGIAPGSTTVDVIYNGETIDTVDVIVLAVIPADITWMTRSDWVVYKDGLTGPWVLLQRDAVSGHYLFTVTDPDSLFAVAEMYQATSGMNTVDIAYLKVDDLLNNTLVTNNSVLASNVTIDVTGAQDTDQGFLTSYDIVNSQYYWSPSYDLDITPGGLYAETSDLLASIFETDASGNRLSVHYYRQNDVAFSDGFNTSIDIRGPLSFAADIDQTVSVVGLNGGEDHVYLDAEFSTVNGSLLNIARYHLNTYGQDIITPVAMRYRGLPGTQHRAGDTYRITAKAGYLDGVEVRKIMSTAVSGDYALTLPAPMLPADFSWEFLNTGTNLTSRFSWTAHLDSEYGQADYFSIALRHITTDVSWNIKIDPAWLDPAAMSIDTPDFSTLPGWDTAFNISEGYATYARLRAYHSNVTDTELLRDGLVEGVIVNQLSLSQTLFP